MGLLGPDLVPEGWEPKDCRVRYLEPLAFNPRGGRRDQGSSYRGRPTNYRGQNYRPNYREENASCRNTDAAGISDDVRRESGTISSGN